MVYSAVPPPVGGSCPHPQNRPGMVWTWDENGTNIFLLYSRLNLFIGVLIRPYPEI
jgi:hypothetical protein